MSFTVTRENGVASCNCQLRDISNVMLYASTTAGIGNFNDVTLANGLQALKQKCLTLNLTLQHFELMKLTCFLSIPLDYLMKSERGTSGVGLTFDGWRFCVQPLQFLHRRGRVYHAKSSVYLCHLVTGRIRFW